MLLTSESICCISVSVNSGALSAVSISNSPSESGSSSSCRSVDVAGSALPAADSLKEKVKILKNKYNGEEVEEELIDNQTALEKLENILEKRKEMGENSDERELYEEENDKIEDWKARVKDQDEMLDEVEEGVKNIKNEAERAGEGISNINKKVKKTQKKMDKTSKKVKTQNDKLKDLVEQIRSSDKICCDLILILILLGLICVLYSVIKHKFIKK